MCGGAAGPDLLNSAPRLPVSSVTSSEHHSNVLFMRFSSVRACKPEFAPSNFRSNLCILVHTASEETGDLCVHGWLTKRQCTAPSATTAVKMQFCVP